MKKKTDHTKKSSGVCSSKYKGVSWHRSNHKWQAVIREGRRLVHLGYFDTETAANDAVVTRKK